MNFPHETLGDASQIGDALRRWRLVLELPASVVAERAGISLSTLRAIERGEGQNSRFGAFLALTRVLGIQQNVFDAVEPLHTELGVARADRMLRKRAPR